MTTVTVDTIDNQAAYAGLDMNYCGESVIHLSAEQPQFGNGLWTTSDPNIHITNPNVNNTTAYNLPSGITEFVWTIYNGVCGGYVSDTVSIQYAPPVNAVNDTVSTDIGVAIPAINVVLNDVAGNTAGWSVGILQEPSHGTAVNNGDGTFGYTPNGGYSGIDAFTYQICSSVCPDLCDTALVIVFIGGEITCVDEIPNLFTPNGDGQNDEFFVSCADTYLNNELQIFNRWGDKVYQAAPYHNDWYGTYGGSDLPEGTYFYIFKYKDDNGVEQKASGYVMIHR
jgi:gliding motility-associated-like protein